jgi:hypothetical protein
MKRIAVALVPAALAFAAARAPADEILLKNGRTLEGKATEVGENVIFERAGIRMEIRKDEVKEIRRTPTAKEQYAAKAAELDAAAKPDAEARHRLGLWCETKGLKDEARAEQEKAVKLDPEHAGARRALGFVKVDGAWRSEAEVMKARGLVLSQGRWMTPEEAARSGEEASSKEKARLAAKERERTLKKSLNAALRKVAAASAATRAEGEKALVAVAKEIGDSGLEAKAGEIRTYYDRLYEEIESARAVVQVRAQLVTLKRPIPTFTTSLGAFSTPVTLQLPELSVVSINTTAVVPLEVEED